MSKKSAKQTNNQGVQRRDVIASERASMAVSLLKQRLSYDEIAHRCGYSDRGSAYRAIQRELQRRIHPKIDEYRDQELLILDTIHQKVWEVAFSNEYSDKNEDEDEENENGREVVNKVNLWAVDRLLELSRDRRKLLNLDIQPEEINAAMVVVRQVSDGYLSPPAVVQESKP